MTTKILRDIVMAILSDFHRTSAGTDAHPDDIQTAVDEIMRAIEAASSEGTQTDIHNDGGG